MRQLIIIRKDLNMSPGKMAAQCSHASMAFLVDQIKKSKKDMILLADQESYQIQLNIAKEIYDYWFCDIYTKTICAAKNKFQLLKAKTMAEELGLVENKDFFLIKDRCLTELEPEEIGENGVGETLTCIGFCPLPDDIAHQISN